MGDLTTIDDVKNYLGVKATDAFDTTLCANLIVSVTAFIDEYTDRNFDTLTFTNEQYNGNNNPGLYMRNWPLQKVSAVSIDDVAVPSSSFYIAGKRTIGLKDGRVFTRGLGNVLVTYTAGYATVPKHVAQAATEMVAFKYRERVRLGESSKSIAGESITWDLAEIPASAKVILDHMKEVITA